MTLKTPLLFWLILILFCGCRQTEKKLTEPKKVHEINVGRGLSFKIVNGKKQYGFKQFWKFDLLNDSFYIKRNTNYIDSPGNVNIRAGKYQFKQDTLTLEFINAALKTKNGEFFLRDTAFMPPLDGPEKHIIQYKRDSLTKYFVYQEGPPYFFYTFIARLDTLGRSQQRNVLSPKIDLKDDSLANYFSENLKLKNLPQPPPRAVQKTIKFTQPVKKN
jgi:hypothetical protein